MSDCKTFLDEPLKANSFEELFKREKEARKKLLTGVEYDKGNREKSEHEIWHRGVPKMRYGLLPSLFRFLNGRASEAPLYKQFLEHQAPSKRDWHALFEMQHYFIPTRLLDWTTSFGVALHFALNSDDPLDNPTIWMLNPGVLNEKALAPGARRELFCGGHCHSLRIDDLDAIDLTYCDDYIEESQKLPMRPLAITPEASFPRLRTQRGRFTVHGGKIEPLEQLCSEAVQRIVIKNTAIEEIRERILLTGIDAYSIFPDMVGLADFLRRKHDLSNMARTKALGAGLHRLWKSDLEKLGQSSTQPGWSTPETSIRGIENCVVSNEYLKRESKASMDENIHPLKKWIELAEGGIFTLKGGAGSGKTNCLLNLIESLELYKTQTVIWFPLFRFEPRMGLVWNLQEYLESILEPEYDLYLALSELLRRSDTILILDGLDELSRTKGMDSAKALAVALKEELRLEDEDNIEDAPKVLISCREDIFGKLKKHFTLGNKSLTELIEPLSVDAIKKKLHQDSMVGEKILKFIANYPIFLRFIQDRSLPDGMDMVSSRFFMELTPTDGRGRDENLGLLGKIAAKMLMKRQDFLNEKDFSDLFSSLEIKTDYFFEARPLQMLLKERNGDVRFLHHTIREFVLAWNIYDSLVSPTLKNWNLLTETSNLDYEGAEVYRAVAELTEEDIWSNLKEKWENVKNTLSEVEQWTKANNFAWCCFDAAGMIGVEGETRRNILSWIRETLEGKWDGSDEVYSFNTKYNAVRCLERLHPSAPECYWKWVVERSIRKGGNAGKESIPEINGKDSDSTEKHLIIYGYAVRGFQRSELKIETAPPLLMRGGIRKGEKPELEEEQQKEQDDFSSVLLAGIDALTSYREISASQSFVLVNMTFALIRWFSAVDRDRVEAILQKPFLVSYARSNLRLVLWYWCEDYEDEAIKEEEIGNTSKVKIQS